MTESTDGTESLSKSVCSLFIAAADAVTDGILIKRAN